MPNILSVGQSALNAAQAGLVTTGHNIANANTPGYTRQVVLQQAALGQDNGHGYVGKGTEVAGINRVYDQFLTNSVLSAQIAKGQTDSYYAQIQQVDNMLSDATSGVSPVMQDFFSSVQDLAADPSSTAARQAMLSSANTLAGRFQDMNAQLSEMRQNLNSEIKTSVDSINVYAQQIAKLNDQIERAQSSGNAPNDLLDQRDQAVAQLSQEIKVSVVKQGNTYNVMIGNGQPLVVGTKNYQLSMAASDTDSSRMEIAYTGSNGQTSLLAENSITGGKLGGIIAFRSDTLDSAQSALGRIAISVASSVNAQHALGNDASGQPGAAFFRVAEPVVTASSRNSDKDAMVGAAITDASLLTGGDYQVMIEDPPAVPPNYSVLRLSDNKTFTNSPVAVDGLSFDFPSGMNFISGDQFLVRPTIAGADAASGIAVQISDPAQIAAASAVSVSAAAGNTGTGAISLSGVKDDGSGNLRQPVTIQFSAAGSYTISGAGVPATTQSYTPGAAISYNGWTIKLSGAPAAGDSFAIGPTTSASTADNRNALALAGLQGAATTGLALDAGGNKISGVSFQSAYSQIVSQVGNKTRELQTTSAAADAQYDSAVAAQQAVSGVNLDEEAANLMKYQQAYQAAGKVMKAAGDMFQVLLSLGS
jgi:flagellar hook-associated protein 1 FlgK